MVRKDPSYTPNIEHLVFPSRKGSSPGGAPKVKMGARAKLAEVFALNRPQGTRKPSPQPSLEKSASLSSRGGQRKSKVLEIF